MNGRGAAPPASAGALARARAKAAQIESSQAIERRRASGIGNRFSNVGQLARNNSDGT